MSRTRDKGADRGLRPVQDVVGRIRHDPALNVARFSVGYEERFAGIREAPLADFVGEGEIPWHRIWLIKAGSLVVWDRRERIDLVFGSGTSAAPDLAAIHRACLPEPTAAPTPARRPRVGSPNFAAQPSYRFDRACAAWVPVTATSEVTIEALQVATYNVLFDLYEAALIYSERRRIACLELLHALDADVVALQEVTPIFWSELLATPWVQERYHVSAGPDAAGLQPYGPALLSRWPLALEVHTYSEHKRLLLGQLTLAGRPLTIAAVHLTSDRKDGAADKRAEQLTVLTDRLAREPGDALVLGDFNFGDGDENDQLAAAGLRDAWQQVHPHHPGFTFDPVANPLAAIMTRSGRAVRLDRVLVRAPTGALAPIDVEMFGQRAFAESGAQGLFASDHFGLSALLQVADRSLATLAAAPVHRSALVVLPPADAWPPIEAIRAAHDPSHARWMPHINLVYGFVPEAEFASAAWLVAEVAREHPPFGVRLGELRRFDHRGSTTVWLAPTSEPPGALVALQRALAARFPACDEQGSRATSGFTPHLTVARLTGSEAEIAATIADWQAHWRPLEFTVDAVHLISRRDDEPFVIRARVGLVERAATTPQEVAPGVAPGVVPPPPWAALPSAQHVAAVAAVARACMAALQGAAPCLHIVGSARIGVAAPTSDLDLVFAGPASHDRPSLFAAVCAQLAADGLLDGVRAAASAGLPVLRLRVGDVAVDLQYAGLPDGLPAARLPDLDGPALAALDEHDRRAALACVDADALVRRVATRLEPAGFSALLRLVRAWTRARQLDAGAWGLLGGYSWALLTARAALDAIDAGAPPEPAALLRRFFAQYAAWETGRPVALGQAPSAAATRRAPWPIYTLTPPSFNTARHLTRSTLALLQSELRRADTIVRTTSPGEPLCAPVDAAAHRRRVVLTLTAEPDAEPVCRGWLEGALFGLLLGLEHQGARVRPYPRATRDDDGLHHAIGVDGGSPGALQAVAEAFAFEFSIWPGRPAGAMLTTALITA